MPKQIEQQLFNKTPNITHRLNLLKNDRQNTTHTSKNTKGRN